MILYQYRSVSSEKGFAHFVDLIAKGAMKFTMPCEFNDPFDCCPTAWSEAPDDAFPHAVGDVMNRGLQSALSRLVGICCLTPHADRMLMWSHYGDQHRGVCVGFDEAVLLRTPPRNDHGHPLYTEVKKVEYTDTRPDDSHEDVFNRKSRDWSYEDEYRIISSVKTGTPQWGAGVWCLSTAAIVEVVLGARTSPATQGEIVAALGQHAPEIRIKKAVIDMKKFRIHVEDLSTQPSAPPLVGAVMGPNGSWVEF